MSGGKENSPVHTHIEGITKHDYYDGWIPLEEGNPQRALYERGWQGEKLTHVQTSVIKPAVTIKVEDK